MADGHRPGQVALSSAAQLVGSVGVPGAAVTSVLGKDGRPHMNYRRPRVSKLTYHTYYILGHLSNRIVCPLDSKCTLIKCTHTHGVRMDVLYSWADLGVGFLGLQPPPPKWSGLQYKMHY